MAVISLTILGIVSTRQISQELLPHMALSFMSVTTHYENYRSLSTPEQTERRVTLPLEEVLRTLPHMKSMESTSHANFSNVKMVFEPNTDMKLISQHVRDKINSVKSELPEDLGPVGVWLFDTEELPFLILVMKHKGSKEDIGRAVSNKLSNHFTRIQGIAQAEVRRGMSEERVTINVSQEALSSHNVSLLQVLMAVRDANIQEDLGSIVEGERYHHIRVASKLTSTQEIENLPLPGTTLKVSDVASVSYGFPKRENLFRINGEDAWIIFLSKESGANIVASAKEAKAALPLLEEDPLFEDCEFQVFFDQSDAITTVLSSLLKSGINGAFFALIILLLFLRNLRTTAIVGLSIPLSIICTCNFMHLAEISLNVASMAGMMFAVGMLVDNAVVVMESIHRVREEGVDRIAACIKGTQEVGMAITGATLTTVIVFLPVIFVLKSDFGEFTKQFGLTISFALCSSLLLALTLIPLLGTLFLPKKVSLDQTAFPGARRFAERAESSLRKRFLFVGVSLTLVCVAIAFFYVSREFGSPETLKERCPFLFQWTSVPFFLRYIFEALRRIRVGATILITLAIAVAAVFLIIQFPRFQNGYVRTLQRLLRRRGTTMMVAFLAVAFSLALGMLLEREQYPGLMEGRVRVGVHYPEQYSFEDAEQLMLDLEEMYLPRREAWGVEGLIVRCSESDSGGRHPPGRGLSAKGRADFFLSDENPQGKTQKEIKREIIASLPHWPGIAFEVEREQGENSGNDEVAVTLRGYDSGLLRELAKEVKIRLASVPDVEDVRIGFENPEQELHVRVDRETAMARGVQDLRQLSLIINAALSGQRVGEMRTLNDTVDIYMQLSEEDKKDIESLKKLGIPNAQLELIPLETVASFSIREGPNRIDRLDGRTFVNVVGRTSRKGTKTLKRDILEHMEGLQLQEGYSWELGGRFETVESEMSNLKLVLSFSTFLIFLLLASQFESLIHPFAIMFTFPFASIGVVWALFVTGTTINIVSGCGIIVLAGIVVNNAIVMVDYINALRRGGYERSEAILIGCKHRLRPVLMTALTTIIGLLPMAMGANDSRYALYSAMGKSMVGGLISATLLTLLLLPVVYSLLDDLKKMPRWIGKKVR